MISLFSKLVQIDSCNLKVALILVDLERDDVVCNDLSNDNSGGLVNVVVGGNDRSIDLSPSNIDGSSRSLDVPGDSVG